MGGCEHMGRVTVLEIEPTAQHKLLVQEVTSNVLPILVQHLESSRLVEFERFERRLQEFQSSTEMVRQDVRTWWNEIHQRFDQLSQTMVGQLENHPTYQVVDTVSTLHRKIEVIEARCNECFNLTATEQTARLNIVAAMDGAIKFRSDVEPRLKRMEIELKTLWDGLPPPKVHRLTQTQALELRRMMEEEQVEREKLAKMIELEHFGLAQTKKTCERLQKQAAEIQKTINGFSSNFHRFARKHSSDSELTKTDCEELKLALNDLTQIVERKQAEMPQLAIKNVESTDSFAVKEKKHSEFVVQNRFDVKGCGSGHRGRKGNANSKP